MRTWPTRPMKPYGIPRTSSQSVAAFAASPAPIAGLVSADAHHLFLPWSPCACSPTTSPLTSTLTLTAYERGSCCTAKSEPGPVSSGSGFPNFSASFAAVLWPAGAWPRRLQARRMCRGSRPLFEAAQRVFPLPPRHRQRESTRTDRSAPAPCGLTASIPLSPACIGGFAPAAAPVVPGSLAASPPPHAATTSESDNAPASLFMKTSYERRSRTASYAGR